MGIMDIMDIMSVMDIVDIMGIMDIQHFPLRPRLSSRAECPSIEYCL